MVNFVFTTLVALILIVSIPAFAQKFEKQFFHDTEVITGEFRTLYESNPDVKGPGFVYGELRSLQKNEGYIYISTRFGVFRLAPDGSRMDSLFASDADIVKNSHLSHLYIADGKFFIQNYKEGKIYMSSDKGGNWEVIAELGYESQIQILGMRDENTCLMYLYRPQFLHLPSADNLVLITRDQFKTIDTLDVFELSGSDYLKERDISFGSPRFGETSSDIYVYMGENIYDENNKDSIARVQCYLFKSNDGGDSWSKINFDEDIELRLRYLYQFGDTLYIAGNKWGDHSPYGRLIRSTNGGDTWKNMLEDDKFPYIYDFKAWSAQDIAMSLVAADTEEYYLSWTTDGGENWKYNLGQDIMIEPIL